MNTDIGGIAANVTAAQAAQTAAELAETNAETAESNASTSETNAQIYAAAAQAAAGIPSLAGNALKKLSVNAAEDGVEWVEVQSDPTLGTLTKTFTTDESSTISLTSSVLAPVVSVTKEVPQSGVTNNSWDVNSNTENYTRLDSAYATTLDFATDLSAASFVDSFSVSSQATAPRAVSFNTDGTKMFVCGYSVASVHQYSLSTAYDVSTASFVQSFSISAQVTNATGLAFNADGTKMYILDQSAKDVNEYSLSTGFDISTASYVQNFSAATQFDATYSFAFSSDGNKMYVGGFGTAAASYARTIASYSLSTPFDLSTASFTYILVLPAHDITGIAFNTNGTEMYVVAGSNGTVNKYSLTTAFDLSTASFVVNFSIASQDTNPYGIALNSSISKIFIVGQIGQDVNEYTVPFSSVALGTGSFASADVGKTIEANDGAFVLTATDGSYVETTAPTSYAQVASGDWSMYGVVYNAADGDLELSGVADPATGFDVSTASFVNSLNVSAQDVTPAGIAFNNNGTKMFFVGSGSDSVYEYTLSTSFNLSTASFVDSFSVTSQDTIPRGIAFNTNGTKMFIVGASSDSVHEYTLSVGFDVSTASFVDSFSVSAQDTVPLGIAFNNTGTKMFVAGSSADSVHEYTLSTGFDISTASFVDSFSVSAQDTSPEQVAFNIDGTKMFVMGNSNASVYEYTLSTGFDVSTASFVDSFSVASQDAAPAGMGFNSDGTKMFVSGVITTSLYEYSIGSLAFPTGYHPVHTTASTDTQYWTDINSMTADQAAGDGNVYYAISTDDRTTWTVIDNTDGERDIVRNNGGTWQYNSNATYASETWTNGTTNTELATLAEAMEGAENVVGYDVSTSSFAQSFSVAGQEATPMDVAFNTDGTKMFVIGQTGQDVNEYTLSTGFDVSTASFVDSFSVSSQELYPAAVAFNTDGTIMFVLGDSVNEYTLSTGFDVSTASFVDGFSVTAQDTTPQGLAFSSDGTAMFVIGRANQNVNQYTLSTGFDVSTASYSQNFSVSSQDSSPQGIVFNTDGTKMFIIGSTGDDVNEYTLSTGFDVSTAAFVDAFSVSAQEINPRGIAFNSNGTKMFVIGYSSDNVNEYSVGTTNYTNQMDKTQLDAVTDPNHIALGDDLDLAIVFNMTSGSTVPSSDGVAINYDATVLNKGAVLGTDYDFDAPTSSSVRITALAGNNLKVRVV